VHAALAEFDLAIKALDTYVEIVVSAKDRAEKAAEIGDLESDETLLQTVSEGVLLLCCFGSGNEAQKAKELIPILEKYIEKDIADDLTLANKSAPRVSLRVIAMAYKAIGIGLGNWSRWTPLNESRNDIRAEAIENLERSLAPEFESQNDLSTKYALALLLAESRDLDGSISHVRSALTPREERAPSTHVANELHQPTLSEERDRIPLWHLLALLLSAKQEFDIAGRTCEVAFDQLPSSVTALGHNSRRNNREGDKKQDSLQTKRDWIKRLQSREKERIIETRMTQLALLEITDGSEVAVNHSDNLLALFATLFEDLELEITSEKATKLQQQLEPPKSSAGTVKSFRGSIFGRKRGSKVPSNAGEVPPLPNGGSHNGTTDAPMIKVTPETANGTRQGQQQQLQKEDLKQTVPINAMHDEPSAGNGSLDEKEISEKIGIAFSNIDGSPTSPTRPKESAKQQLPALTHNINSKHQSLPAGHTKQAPEQDVRLPSAHRFDSPTNALTIFPTLQSQKHALSVLVKVWLLISGLYRRASLFEDAREACEEASKQVNAFEALVAAQESSARAFDQRVWGVGKSVEELWGDVYAEKGALSEAQSLFHESMQYYEEAITRYPDHSKATIGLSNLLLDVWEEKIPLEPVQHQLDTDIVKSSFLEPTTHSHNVCSETTGTKTTSISAVDIKKPSSAPSHDDEPGYLSRLAARDRAYGLVSMLTKTGSSWDNSEAWFTLSRAHEAGSQIEKAKEILWWCIELEDEKPIRHWWNLGNGGYVL
jgi:cargo-transport protein YPP1